MAEKSRRGFAAGVVGAGCTLRLAPALYGVTGIGQSRWRRQLLLRISTEAPRRAVRLRGNEGVSVRARNYFWRVFYYGKLGLCMCMCMCM